MNSVYLIILLLFSGCASYEKASLTNSMEDEKFLRSFVLENCGYEWKDRNNQTDEAKHSCQKKWALAFAEKLHKTYPAADLDTLTEKCNDLGDRCGIEEMERIAQSLQATRQRTVRERDIGRY